MKHLRLPEKIRSLQEHLRMTSLHPYRDLGKPGVVWIGEVNKGDKIGVEVHYDTTGFSREVVDYLKWVHGAGLPAVIQTTLTCRTLYDGPKVFKPTLEQCLALEQIMPRVTFREYQQPFPTMTVEFPEEYRTLRQVRTKEGVSKPVFISVAKMEADTGNGSVWFSLCLENIQVLAGSISPQASETLADGLITDDRVNFESPFLTEEGEIELLAKMELVTLNAMLMLCEFGCKKVGPENPSHHDRLERWLTRQRKCGEAEKAERTEAELKAMPVVYGFEQNITLHEETREHAAGEGHSGRTVKAHWRRGFYRQHRHGPGLTLTKRLFIKPVLVNASLYGGGPTSTTYRGK